MVKWPLSCYWVAAIALCTAALVSSLAACADGGPSADTDGDSSNEGTTETKTIVHASCAEVDLPTSIAVADAIVMGYVEGHQWTSRGLEMSEWGRQLQYATGCDDDDIRLIEESLQDRVYTHSRFIIDRTLEGDFPLGEVEIWTLGGKYEGHTCEAPDYPQLKPGDQYVVFLVRSLHGGYEPTAVYQVHAGRATSRSQGRNDDMPIDELIGIIEAHRDDPNPWAPALDEAKSVPHDSEDHPMTPEEERGTRSETTVTQ